MRSDSHILIAVALATVWLLGPSSALAQSASPTAAPPVGATHEMLHVTSDLAASKPLERWAIATQVGGALTLPSVDLAFEGLRRWERFGVLVKIDWNRWVNTQKSPALTMGALNIGVGGEYWYLRGRVRAAVAGGPSILLFRTVLDKPGEIGLFLDCYPSSLTWALSGPFYLRFDPLSFHVIAPVIDAIPLIVFEYRTSVALEWRL